MPYYYFLVLLYQKLRYSTDTNLWDYGHVGVKMMIFMNQSIGLDLLSHKATPTFGLILSEYQ